MTSGKVLITSHTVAFLAGFAAAKAWDYDELSNYRNAHEGNLSKLKRWAGNISIGMLALGAFTLMFRSTLSSKQLRD